MADTDTQFDMDYYEEIKQACQSNDMVSVTELVENDRICRMDFVSKNAPGILEAGLNRNMEIVEYLCNWCHLILLERESNLLHLLIDLSKSPETLDTFRYLVDRFSISSSFIRKCDNIILREASEKTNFVLIRYFCEELHFTKEDFINSSDFSRYPVAFSGACASGCLEMIDYLVDRFSIIMTDIAKCSHFPLYSAIKNGHLDVVRYLCELDFQEYPENYSYQSVNLLFIIIYSGMETDIIECVIRKFDINKSKITEFINKNICFHSFNEKSGDLIRYLLEEIDESLRLNKDDAKRLQEIIKEYENHGGAFGYSSEILLYLDYFLAPKVKNAENK